MGAEKIRNIENQAVVGKFELGHVVGRFEAFGHMNIDSGPQRGLCLNRQTD